MPRITIYASVLFMRLCKFLVKIRGVAFSHGNPWQEQVASICLAALWISFLFVKNNNYIKEENGLCQLLESAIGLLQKQLMSQFWRNMKRKWYTEVTKKKEQICDYAVLMWNIYSRKSSLLWLSQFLILLKPVSKSATQRELSNFHCFLLWYWMQLSVMCRGVSHSINIYYIEWRKSLTEENTKALYYNDGSFVLASLICWWLI